MNVFNNVTLSHITAESSLAFVLAEKTEVRFVTASQLLTSRMNVAQSPWKICSF